MFKNITRKIILSIMLGIFLGVGVFISYATDIINLSSGDVNTGDIINNTWFNNVRVRLTNINDSGIYTGSIDPTKILAGTAGINITGTAATASIVPWAGVTSKPTTIAGYGITDAPTKTGLGASGTWGISITGNATTASSVPRTGVTSKPTTIAGYGITDAPTKTGLGASGTWGISITGNATTATNATNANNSDTTDGYHLNQNVTNGSNPQWGTTYTNNWFRSQGATGWYNETYGGGWYMNDTTRVKAYNGKGIYTDSSLYVGGFINQNNPFGVNTIVGETNFSISPVNITKRLSVSSDIRATGEVVGGLGYGQFRAVSGAYGTMIRNDGANTYFLVTNARDQYGSWNGLRPFAFNNVTGHAEMLNGLTVNGGFTNLSDRRLKTNIRPLENYEDILKIDSVRFDWKKDGKSDIGVIAQDVEKYFPELVRTDDNGYKSVSYISLVVPLMKVVKNQQQQIEIIKKENNSFKKILCLDHPAEKICK
ncbi:MAG: tail fiber domain-containing protein [Candidatus Gracilibacteria bacterium]